MKLRLTLAYDGTRFLGWQKTKEGPSIEESLGQALRILLRHEVQLESASRTDRGVHAENQVAHLSTPLTPDLKKLQYSLNALLAPDIAVKRVEEVEEGFHATLDAKGKEYHYKLSCGRAQLPFDRHFAWHVPQVLDLERMRQAAGELVGERDFAAFCNERREDTVRVVTAIEVEEMPQQTVRIVVRGRSFLYKMVRNIVGMLVFVGQGKLEVGDVARILASRERAQGAVTAPAHGLCLHRVFYD